MIDAMQVKQTAEGRWLEILLSLAPTLEAAVNSLPNHVPCPINGGKDGFRFFKDAPITGAGYSNKEGAFGDGFAVLQFVTGVTFKDALGLVANYLGLSDKKPLYIQPKPVMQSKSFELSPREVLLRKGKLNGFWGQASKVQNDDRVHLYLISRGIDAKWITKIPSIRFHPNAWYKDKNDNQSSAPTMLLKFQSPDGTPCNIHKTFLSTKTTGKADINDPKLMMKPSCKMRGGAVRIGDIDSIVRNDGVLHVSEGFENGATIADVHEQPSWATLNWALLQGFIPPQEVKTLVIWSDNDPLDEKGNNAGTDAAKKLQARLKTERPDLKIILKIPPNKKEDWNDLYQMGRMELFSLESE
jgi:phage/plasmid primase-like uncharacterized protein